MMEWCSQAGLFQRSRSDNLEVPVTFAVGSGKNPLEGVDLDEARHRLAGLPERRLDGDWLAIDENGHVALFAGNERGAIPGAADVARVDEALLAIARAAAARRASAGTETYRGSVAIELDPVFDAPCSS